MIDMPAARPVIVELPKLPVAGMLRFIRYGFTPNRLRYRGGENRLGLDHAVEKVIAGGLEGHRAKFTGALPYLKLFGRASGIADPFDPRVVDAYWIGNNLLDRVEVRQLYDSPLERFGEQLQGRRCVPTRRPSSSSSSTICPRFVLP